MKKIFLLCAINASITANLFSQSIGIGTTTPDPNAILELKSSTKGLLLPRTSTTTRLLIPAVKGLMVYDTITSSAWINDGTQWVQMSSGGGGGAGWALNGNAGTTSANFLGTTDNNPLYFKINNTWAGQIADLNTFIGKNSGEVNTIGSGNVAFGNFNLSANTTGYSNTATGLASMQNNINGYQNTATGIFSLNANTSGYLNTATGAYSMQTNTTGHRNTATGYGALNTNDIGNDNVATGMYSSFYNSSGSGNTANGFYAMYTNTTGNNNTAVGQSSLQNGVVDNNTAVGYSALLNSGGTGNTAIGYNADVFNGAVSNAVAIGNGTIVGVTNRMRMGNVLVTAIESFGTFSTLSDARFKTGIQENVKGLDFILKLRPVTYYIDKQKVVEFEIAQMPEKKKVEYRTMYGAALKEKGNIHSGFLAQEVVQAMQQSGYEFDGVSIPENEQTQNYSLAYGNFTVPLVKAMQEQQVQIEALKKENTEMKKKQLEMEKRLLQLEQK
jgi:carbonic anhydrase/acetyltransferase-like protein (isoleucine patch superfamily)